MYAYSGDQSTVDTCKGDTENEEKPLNFAQGKYLCKIDISDTKSPWSIEKCIFVKIKNRL